MSMPQISIASLKVSKLIIGGNPFSGISHQSNERDAEMLDYYTADRIKRTLAECERCGINTFIGRADNHVARVLREYWNEGGKIQWIAQSAPERKSLLDNIRMAHKRGASAFFVQGGHTHEICRTWTWEEFAEAIDLIRDLGLPAGAAAHYPEFHAERLRRGIALDFACQCLYRVEGRKGRIHEHVETNELFVHEDRTAALEQIAAMPEPAIAYKVLGGGRMPPRQAFEEVRRYLGPKDAILMGMFTKDRPDMVAENVRLVEEFFTPAAV
ncbi:MAG: hypothetical protein BIFFINMI_03381 [Phycisphaerae bacterium]|nr:hypothetical protein [Phycisphaerae bacterium]